jgi:hypothetical protein
LQCRKRRSAGKHKIGIAKAEKEVADQVGKRRVGLLQCPVDHAAQTGGGGHGILPGLIDPQALSAEPVEAQKRTGDEA